ncbi:MAG: LAGLIDADG family homing endonuclease [Candidatus Zambryskibacteria bacterium]|nr:LAGLIDADG family homing endonuclease [Candidatus Zambryskibacteria bacterium]
MGRTKPTVLSEYVVGLTDGEGCFYVNLGKFSSYKSGFRVQLHFHIKMQEKDKKLLEKIKNTIGCGAVYFQKEQRQNHCQCYRYTVSSQKDIFDLIIPFFKQHPLQSFSKQKNFEIFCKIAKLVQLKSHLTKKGLTKIKKLKSEMNKKTVGLA